MDKFKGTPGYAETQIRLLLSDINSSSHNVRLKAITRFQDYIKVFKPEVYDDDVDMLYQGIKVHNSQKGYGLLQCSGLDSEKHSGQLKRIAAPAIGLIRWLITFTDYGNDNIFYDRFVQLSEVMYMQMNLSKHINQDIKVQNSARLGSSGDAFIIATIITRDHRNPEHGEHDPISLATIIPDKTARDKYTAWLTKGTSQSSHDSVKYVKKKTAKIIRPTVWESVKFRPIPFQDGEDAGDIEETSEVLDHLAIPDPLGLKEVDLKERQDAYAEGRINVFSPNKGRSSLEKKQSAPTKKGYRIKTYESDSDEEDVGFDDVSSQSSDEPVPTESVPNPQISTPRLNKELSPMNRSTKPNTVIAKKKVKTTKLSVIPKDKNFSVGLFLRLIHQDITFEDFKHGLNNLETKLNQQSNQRENLVRSNYGLFIECTDGITWLKDFRLGRAILPLSNKPTKLLLNQSKHKIESVLRKGETGEQKLIRGAKSLDVAKREAQKTLAPILDRMRRSRKIKSADKVLRRLATTLEYPHRMQKALDKEDYTEVINIYQRIIAIPTSSSLRVLQRVRESADNIIKSAKLKCLTVLQTPSTEVGQLLRHAKISRDLEGEESYKENLKLCFGSQCNAVADTLQAINDRFLDQAVSEFTRGQEYAIHHRNAVSVKNDNITSNLSPKDVERDIVRDLRRRWLTSSKAILSGTSQKNRSDRVHSYISSGYTSGYTSSYVSEEENFDFNYENDEMDQDEFNVIFDRDLDAGIMDRDVLNDGLNDNGLDIRTLLSVKVRLEHVHEVIDCMKLWIPCLQRLVIELSTVTANAPVVGGIRANNRNPQLPYKLFSLILSTFSDLIKQGFNGYSTQTGTIITDLISSIRTMNTIQSIPTIQNQPINQPMVIQSNIINARKKNSFNEFQDINKSTHSDTSTDRDKDRDRDRLGLQSASVVNKERLTVLSTTYYYRRLPEFCQLSVLNEISDLYDSIDQLLSSSSSASGTTTSSSSASSATSTGVTQSVSGKVTVISVDTRLQKNSPYYDSLNLLRDIARDGEVMISQRIINRLLEIILTRFSSFHSSSEDIVNANNNNSNGGNSNSKNKSSIYPLVGKIRKEQYSPQRVELMARNFQGLMLRSVQKIIDFIHRPDWVSNVIFEGFQRAIASFTEILRREYQNMGDELIQIQQTRMNRSASIVPSTPRDRSGSVMRSLGRYNSTQSIHRGSSGMDETRGRSNTLRALAPLPDAIDLQSLDDDLQLNCAPTAEKSILMLDIMRALVYLRTKTAPIVWSKICKVFHSSINVSNSGGNNSNNIGTTGDSIINRIFTTVGNKTGKPESLSERLIQAIEEQDNTGNSSAVANIMLDTAKLEEQVTMSIVDMKISSIRISIVTYYSVIAKREISFGKTSTMNTTTATSFSSSLLSSTGQSKTLPTHLAKVLLVLGFEKIQFETTLGEYTIEYGVMKQFSTSNALRRDSRHDRKSNTGNSSTDSDSDNYDNSDGEDGDEEDDDDENGEDDYGDEDDGTGTGTELGKDARSIYSTALYNQSGKGEMYYKYMFKELCLRVVSIYQDLIKKLATNAFLTQKQSQTKQSSSLLSSSSSPMSPRALGQAIEECEFLKTVIRQVLPSESLLQPSNYSSYIPNSSKNGAGLFYPTSEQLQKIGQIYTVMIIR